MNKEYEQPTIEIIEFINEDVLTASQTVEFDPYGFGEGGDDWFNQP